jgi:hypothetical protein
MERSPVALKPGGIYRTFGTLPVLAVLQIYCKFCVLFLKVDGLSLLVFFLFVFYVPTLLFFGLSSNYAFMNSIILHHIGI